MEKRKRDGDADSISNVAFLTASSAAAEPSGAKSCEAEGGGGVPSVAPIEETAASEGGTASNPATEPKKVRLQTTRFCSLR